MYVLQILYYIRQFLEWRQAYHIAMMVLVFLVGSLLYHNYAIQSELQNTILTRMESNLVDRAKAMDYFLQERKLDIIELSKGSDVHEYFTNQSQGKSPQYGLEESRSHILRSFKNFVTPSSGNSGHQFSALWLFDQEGKGVVDYSLLPPSKNVLSHLETALEFHGTDVSIRLHPKLIGFLEISAQIKIQGEEKGHIVGLIPLNIIYNQFFPNKSTRSYDSKNAEIILIAGFDQFYVPSSDDIQKGEVEGLLNSLDASIFKYSGTINREFGKEKNILLISSPFESVPLNLVWIVDTNKVFGTHSSLFFFTIFGMVALIVMMTFFLIGRQRTKSQILATRLDASSRVQLSIEQKNQILMQEIQQRKTVEKALMYEQSLLRSLLDSIPYLIFYKTKDLRFQGCNAAFAQFVGLPQECLLGQHVEDVFYSNPARFLWEYDQHVVNQGIKIRKEELVNTLDGSKILLDTLKTPYYSPQGETIGLISISRDISKRRQMEDDLAKQRERLDFVIQAADIGKWDWHFDSGEIFINEHWTDINDSAPEELQSVNIETWQTYIHPDDLGRSNQYLEKYLNGETKFYECEYRILHKDGRWIWILDRGRVVQWSDTGKPIRMSGIHVDITRRIEAETNLKLLNETLEQQVESRTAELNAACAKLFIQEKMASIGQLAAGVAHELNNPINFIQINFSVLQDYFFDVMMLFDLYKDTLRKVVNQDEQNQITDQIFEKEKEVQIEQIMNDIPLLFDESNKGFERIGHIIRTMRDFSRQEQDEQFAKVDINQCIEDTLIISRNEYKYCSVIERKFSQIPHVDGVKELLNQVFLNLVVNSAQANLELKRDEKGVIVIRTWSDEKFVYCSFQDNGPGIPSQYLNRIFEPFFTTKSPGNGTGLGLSISYEIVVHKHRGNLFAENLASGGAIFTVVLPVQHEGEVNRH